MQSCNTSIHRHWASDTRGGARPSAQHWNSSTSRVLPAVGDRHPVRSSRGAPPGAHRRASWTGPHAVEAAPAACVSAATVARPARSASQPPTLVLPNDGGRRDSAETGEDLDSDRASRLPGRCLKGLDGHAYAVSGGSIPRIAPRATSGCPTMRSMLAGSMPSASTAARTSRCTWSSRR